MSSLRSFFIEDNQTEDSTSLIYNYPASCKSERLKKKFEENCQTTAETLPCYEDPQPKDEEQFFSLLRNRLRHLFNFETIHLSRSQLLNEKSPSSHLRTSVRAKASPDLFDSSSEASSLGTCCVINNINESNAYDMPSNICEIDLVEKWSEASDQAEHILPQLSNEWGRISYETIKNDVETPELPLQINYNDENNSIFGGIDRIESLARSLDNTEMDDFNADHFLKERRSYLIDCIQELIKSLISNYNETGDVQLFVDDTSRWDNLEFTEQMLKIKSECTVRRISVNDGRTQFRFNMINYMLNEILKRLIAGINCTIRELYYQDPILCRDQLSLTKSLHDICSLLRCTPWELRIYSASKGLVAGSLLISFADNTTIDCSNYQHMGFLLPKDVMQMQIVDSNAEFVLVVEKDTVFEKLLQHKIFDQMDREFILMTGKGYPDINTRLLLRKILNKYPIPVYALVDADPFGIEIMLIYSYGSKELSYMSHWLACPEIEWIGILPSEIELLSIPSSPLAAEDKSRIDDLFKRPYITDKVQRELTALLEFDRKTEIESLSSISFTFLVNNYIRNKVAGSTKQGSV